MSRKVYHGVRVAEGEVKVDTAEVSDTGFPSPQLKPLDLRLSVLNLADEPEAFDWGLGDFGPNPGAKRLGFALLSDWIGDEARALDLLDDFVTLVILMLPDRAWMLEGHEIENAIAA